MIKRTLFRVGIHRGLVGQVLHMRVSGASIEINDEAPEEDHPGVAERQSVSGVNSVFIENRTDTNKP